jgi:ATP-dependent DNA helicase RecG
MFSVIKDIIIEGITEAAYLYSQISMPRNITIAEVFHRLHIIEKFGTGIDRIQREYKPYTNKPEFKIMSHFISINLPVVEYNGQPVEDDLNQKIIHLISKNDLISRAQLEKLTGYKKTRVHEILKLLVNQGIIETV